MPKLEGSEGLVLRLALVSRLLLLTLLLVWRRLFDPYDTSAALSVACLSPAAPSPPPACPRAAAAIERSVVWDAVYFVRIAECGYEYEQTFAFFPLLPLCINALSRSVFALLVPIIGYRAVLVVSGYVLSNAAFVLAAIYFHRLSVLILKDDAAALRASILFCFNPASIFYSSIYSESLYALFSLGGIFYLFSGANTIAMLLLALSGSARSNGALNAGYFCFMAIYDAIIYKKDRLAVKVIIAGARSLFIFAPFVAFQAYGYFNICQGAKSDELRPWCRARIPHLYGYLQSHYWGVGFLKYFQLKQLPNFLLASPILLLSVSSIFQYVLFLPQVLRQLGTQEKKNAALVQYSAEAGQSSEAIFHSENIFYSKRSKDHMGRQRKRESKEKEEKGPECCQDSKTTGTKDLLHATEGYGSIFALPFILHLGFMTFTSFFVMHVQVATRFLSASPPIYWYASYVLVSPGATSARFGYFIWVYFASYILIGSLLFSNFYPFT